MRLGIGAVEMRRAGPADCDAAAHVITSSRLNAIPAIPAPVHSAEEVRSWFSETAIPDMEVWVAEGRGGDGLVGVMVLNRGWVEQLYILPAWTGKGIGKRLVDLGKSRNPGGLQLWTFQSNTRAGQFYEREGFHAVEETDGSGNEERRPDVRYQWRPAR